MNSRPLLRIAATALVAFSLGTLAGYRAHQPPVDPVVARVNGEEIRESQLNSQVHGRFANLVLRDMVQEKAILQEATKENVQLDPAEITRRVNEAKTQGDTQALLKSGQLSEQDLVRNANTLLPLDALTEKHIREDDEKEFLLRHREELETLKLEKRTYADEETAKRELTALASGDKAHPAKSAEILEVHRAELDPSWAELLFRLHPGELSPVLHGEEGFHVFRVLEHQMEYAKLKKVVHEQLVAEKRHEIAEDIRQKAKIEVLPPYQLPTEVEVNSPESNVPGTRPSGVPRRVPVETD